MRDIYDGKVVQDHIERDVRFLKDLRNIMLGLVIDPFQTFKDDARTSACPFLIVNYNVSPHLRYKLGVGCHMVAIGKGSAEKDLKKRSYDPVNELMCDELDWLDRVGYDPCLGADLLDGAPPPPPLYCLPSSSPSCLICGAWKQYFAWVAPHASMGA